MCIISAGMTGLCPELLGMFTSRITIEVSLILYRFTLDLHVGVCVLTSFCS